MIKRIVIAAAMALVASQASAATIFSDSFNSYTFGSTNTQVNTALLVGAGGTLSGWTGAGLNNIHAVQRSTGDWAVMLYGGTTAAQKNVITMNSGVAANDLGATYSVDFLSAAANYATVNQGNATGDLIRFEVLRANNTVLSTFNYDPADWSTVTSAANYAFTNGTFSYTGDGTGNVRLRISAPTQSGRFGGAVDNVSISGVPEPATWAMIVCGFGLIGAASRRRRPAPYFA